MLRRPLILIVGSILFLSALPQQVLSHPARIIILRHGEKKNSTALCDVGVERSLALAAQYLGQGSMNSLFTPNRPPTAFFGVTLHCLELGAPAVATWGKAIAMYAVVPVGQSDEEELLEL
jgi:hypothetical protein